MILNVNIAFTQEYRVQVAAYIENVSPQYFLDAGVEDVYLNTDQHNIHRYFIGEFKSHEKALEVKELVIKRGFKYAQVIDMVEQRALCGAPCPYMTNSTTFSSEDIEQLFMRSIFFDYNKSILSAESKSELNGIFEILKENPNLRAQFVGHTDSRGSATYNLSLATRRAKTACNYLIHKGIPASRLETTVYGESAPIAVNRDLHGNDAPEGRKYNRRVVISLVDEKGEVVKDFGTNVSIPRVLKYKSGR